MIARVARPGLLPPHLDQPGKGASEYVRYCVALRLESGTHLGVIALAAWCQVGVEPACERRKLSGFDAGRGSDELLGGPLDHLGMTPGLGPEMLDTQFRQVDVSDADLLVRKDHTVLAQQFGVDRKLDVFLELVFGRGHPGLVVGYVNQPITAVRHHVGDADDAYADLPVQEGVAFP